MDTSKLSINLSIIYVEDTRKDAESLDKMVKIYNEKNKDNNHIDLKIINRPDKLTEILNPSIDLVLADCYLDEEPMLVEIINIVENWSGVNGIKKRIPIIAYTRYFDKALTEYGIVKNKLYDIWGKDFTSPDNIFWHFDKLTSDLSRYKPDAFLQRHICSMKGNVSWHKYVIDMAKNYDSEWTEFNQISKAGQSVKDIANKLKVDRQINPLWNLIEGWEMLDRVASKTKWGHARHVINVFWLGYYIIHQPEMSDFIRDSWENIKYNRSRMGPIKAFNEYESFCDMWFYAALFHDTALCIENLCKVEDSVKNIMNNFDYIKLQPSFNIDFNNLRNENMFEIMPFDAQKSNDGDPNFSDNRFYKNIKNIWLKSIEKNTPDHGILGALNLASLEVNNEQKCFIKEAARAISLHNIFGLFSDKDVVLSWNEEPMACLLILCDQLQSWDRENRSINYLSNHPDRSELLDVHFDKSENHKLKLTIKINYLSPSYFKHMQAEKDIMREELKEVLRSKPNNVLMHFIDKPFRLNILFYLDNESMDADFIEDA